MPDRDLPSATGWFFAFSSPGPSLSTSVRSTHDRYNVRGIEWCSLLRTGAIKNCAAVGTGFPAVCKGLIELNGHDQGRRWLGRVVVPKMGWR
jgi:hypothetical protein